MRMNELVERYLRGRKHEVSYGTYKNVESTISRFGKAWEKTRRSTSSLTEDWVSDWLHDISAGSANGGRPISPEYYNKEVERLRHFLHYLVRRGACSPFVIDSCKLAPKSEPKQYLRMQVAQIVQMIETCPDPWERWVLALASQTLGRDSELRSRRVAHMRLDLGELDWFRKKTTDVDKLPITKQLREEWQRWAMHYQEKCGPLDRNRGWFLVPARRHSFGHWSYKPDRSPYDLADIVKKHASRVSGIPLAELKGQGVHIVRRSMARALYDRLVELGTPEPTALNRVQVMLGHSSPQTTMIYIGVQPDRLKRNELLSGSSLLWVEQDNVVQLKAVGDE